MMTALRIHESADRIPTGACDNVECARISFKTEFRCCSGCESVNYCSVDCQRLDWRRGHRNTCRAIRLHSLQNPGPLTCRDRSFLRTLMDCAYTANLMAILLTELLLLHQNGPDNQWMTIMRFVEGKFSVECIVMQDFTTRRQIEFLGPVVEDQLSRATASGGRNHLHAFIFSDAPDRPVGCLSPLRAHDGALHAGLVDLARQVPPGVNSMEDLEKVPGMLEKVQALKEGASIWLTVVLTVEIVEGK
ncbi:hypothetical protein FB45DRAFT_1008367 [Roridomyces roridus]|uniref:MYND-type domain-containing protein n=1 Tax=Roridomyces roridus TaxID=1738132 RepID=A0AAD7BAA4_9AGAR|nr:hypothetical protein FB45DRAFT_1008367 [Roridomyces roridus]